MRSTFLSSTEAPAMELHGESTSFGNFRLHPRARLLEKDGVPLSLGDRALDILIALVERAGEVVSHKDLISHAWRGLIVEPGNLRVHMTSLRKTLGEARGRNRFIANVPGQGYSFVAPVTREESATPSAVPEYPCGAARARLVLPPALSRMVGRDDAIRTVCADVIADRFVTIVGTGGMGKTTVATAVAHALSDEFCGAVCFVDVSAVSEPALVVSTIASTLGLTVQNDEVLPALLKCLQSLRVLLILDNCEHVIDAAAQLAERIFHEAPSVHILATSREALRAEGEHAFWLPPISSPSIDRHLDVSSAMQFPAVRLFIERATAGGARLDLNDENASLIADICARLEGLALAIEITAGRVATHGLRGTAELVRKRIGMHWRGRRTAPPRHQTLQALLDWSYEALSDAEQRVLRRLSTLVGSFTREAAVAIASESGAAIEADDALLDSLVAKSLVSISAGSDSTVRYRLLEITRSYLFEKLMESAEADSVAHRHAIYFSRLLASSVRSPASAGSPDAHLGNIRAALEWCFSSAGRSATDSGKASGPPLTIELAAGAAPVFLELSLLHECQKWSTAALARLDDATRGTRLEMVLQEARASSSTWGAGDCDSARSAIVRAIEIAREHDMTSHQLELLVGMHLFLLRIGDRRGTAAVAERFAEAVRDLHDPTYEIIADWLSGMSHHFMGSQGPALQCFRRSFANGGHRGLRVFGLDYQVRALVTYDRILWLSGYPEQALRVARQALTEAARVGSPLNICFAYLYTTPCFIWCGDHATALELLAKLRAHPNWHALPSMHATANAIQGELLIQQGRSAEGIELLESGLASMKKDNQVLLYLRALCVLAEGLAAANRIDEALGWVRGVLDHLAGDSAWVEYPELLRVHAQLLMSVPSASETEIEQILIEAAQIARAQCAPAWELRIAMTHSRLLARQERFDEARELLSAACAQFTEGFDTRDLQAAHSLLEELQAPSVTQAEARTRKRA